MTDAIDITSEQRKTLLALLRRFIPGVAVWAYGSRVKWTARPNSDLDLVAFTTPAQRHLVSELKEAFDESNLPFLVDFHVWDEVPERFHEIIRKEYVVLLEAEENRVRRGVACESAKMCPTVENLPNGWQVKRLSSFCTKIGTGATPRGGSEVYLDSRVNHALIRSQNVFDRHFDNSGLAFITEAHARELRNAEVRSGDVLLNITGDGVTFGRSCLVPDSVLPACVNQHVSIIRTDRNECEPGYLLSVLTHPATKGYIESFNSGGSRRAITKGHIESFEIPLPPIPEQKAIAHILGTLDDKIELNRRMNATLEAMARALFQSWFVDFDPVRRNVDRSDQFGLTRRRGERGEKAIQAGALLRASAPPRDPNDDLFPAHFQDSPLGHIPQGWEVKPMSEVIEVNPRRTLKAGTISPYLDMKNMPTQGHAADEIIHREFSSGTKFQNGDTLLARITPCLENGKSAFVDFLKEGQVGWGSTEYIVFAPKPPLTPEFGYYLARSDALRLHAIQNMTGTSGRQRVPSDCFAQFQLAVPPAKIAQRFGEITKPWMMKIHANIEQSRTLVTLRDTLLPKLLSGELRVVNVKEEAARV